MGERGTNKRELYIIKPTSDKHRTSATITLKSQPLYLYMLKSEKLHLTVNYIRCKITLNRGCGPYCRY